MDLPDGGPCSRFGGEQVVEDVTNKVCLLRIRRVVWPSLCTLSECLVRDFLRGVTLHSTESVNTEQLN